MIQQMEIKEKALMSHKLALDKEVEELKQKH